jgi:hypothetical protein
MQTSLASATGVSPWVSTDMFDPEPTLVERLVGPFLLSCQLLAAGFLGRHEDLHVRQRERQEAQIL